MLVQCNGRANKMQRDGCGDGDQHLSREHHLLPSSSLLFPPFRFCPLIMELELSQGELWVHSRPRLKAVIGLAFPHPVIMALHSTLLQFSKAALNSTSNPEADLKKE